MHLNQTSYFKNHFQLKVKRLLQTVLFTSKLNNFDIVDLFKSIHLRYIVLETFNIVILYTVIQYLKASTPSLVSFIDFAACYFDSNTFLLLPYYSANEDKVQEARAFYTSMSLLLARALSAERR